jgi:hypothetical protein
MKKIFLASLLALALLPAGFQAHAATLEGQRFADTAQLARHELQLNGLGVRAVFIFKAFVAGLYLPQKTSQPQQILGQPGPRRLQLRMLMDIGSSDIKKALIDGMRKNVSDGQWQAMQDRVAEFARTIDSIGTARTGDTIDLDFAPERGMTLAVNDVPRGGVVGGAEFYNAMLAIFVGDDPVDGRLKNGLLGQ